MDWIATSDKLHPDKPGRERYEQIPCLIVRRRDVLLRQWNCEHLVWDTEDGDDFYCEASEVTHWMPVPPLPPNAEVSGCLRAPMPEDAPRAAAGSPLDRPVGPVAGA